jgi:hypothetical protein
MPTRAFHVTCAIAAGVLVGLVAPAGASAGALLTTGTLTDRYGFPASGTVQVWAWPHTKGPAKLPLLGKARTVFGGEFAVTARDDRRLVRLSRQRDGWLDFTATAETATGRRSEWTFTGFVARDARGDVRVLSPRSALGDAAASASGAAPRIRLRADRPPLAAAAQQDCSRPQREVDGPHYRRAWAVVGELNNAYNDGTRSRFVYGEDHVTETQFGVVTPGDQPGSVVIEGENTISERGRLGFGTVRRRYSRRLYSKFEFERTRVRMTPCSAWDVYLRAKEWIGGGSERRQRGMLDRCIPGAVGGHPGGYDFYRASNNAVRWKHGVSVFGLSLTTRSGFSTHVTTSHAFGGPQSKQHYLCGQNGVDGPYTAGRIASGARAAAPTVHNR